MNFLKIELNKSTHRDILNHLTNNDHCFVPKLSSYVDIKKYSLKLANHATRFELWNDQLQGLLAYYEVEKNEIYFITNFSVDHNFKRQGFATILLKELILVLTKKSKKNPIKIQLEVYENNQKAIEFYMVNGFKKVGLKEKVYTMERTIDE